jgi:hypothetical protein
MGIVYSFVEYGPLWVLVGVLLMMVFYLFSKVLSVIKGNTYAFSKFSEIISNCQKNSRR